MSQWYEFRLIFSEGDKTRGSVWPEENYQFIKNQLIPLIKRLHITNFHILNYFDLSLTNPNERDFIRLRVEVNESLLKQLKDEIINMIREGEIIRYEYETHSLRKDAEDRIESVRLQLIKMIGRDIDKNWDIAGIQDGLLQIAMTADYDKKVKDFENFLGNVLGNFIIAFYEQISEKPYDKWLMSLFMHLMLNSICFDKTEEITIRQVSPL